MHTWNLHQVVKRRADKIMNDPINVKNVSSHEKKGNERKPPRIDTSLYVINQYESAYVEGEIDAKFFYLCML